MKLFYVLKDIILKVKGQTAEWEKVFVSPMSEKDSYRLHKELLYLKNKKKLKIKMIYI